MRADDSDTDFVTSYSAYMLQSVRLRRRNLPHFNQSVVGRRRKEVLKAFARAPHDAVDVVDVVRLSYLSNNPMLHDLLARFLRVWGDLVQVLTEAPGPIMRVCLPRSPKHG